MRCSSCESLLDRYVEGTLTPRQMVAVRAHVAACAGCASLLDELKVVDGLLFTTRAAGLPENFTFALMAEVRTQPAPAPPPARFWSFLALYLAAVWAGFVVWIALTGTDVRTAALGVVAALAPLGRALSSLPLGAQPFAHSPFLLTVGLGAVALDVAIVVALFIFYKAVRHRLALSNQEAV